MKIQYDLPDIEWLYPKRLIERCAKWGMPASAFNIQASFYRTFIWQVMDEDFLHWNEERQEWESKGGIAASAKTVDSEFHKCARGILVSAGLRAREQLETNNIQIGDYVRVVRVTPMRLPFMDGASETSRMIVCSAAHVVGSEDSAARLRDGKHGLSWTQNEQYHGYRYEGPDIPGTYPENPEHGEDL